MQHVHLEAARSSYSRPIFNLESLMVAEPSKPVTDSPLHILILDANASAALVTRAGVQRVVPQASIASESTPENAWASAQTHKPDLLILDPAPAELASAWLVQNIKTAYPDIHIIVLASAPTSTLR